MNHDPPAACEILAARSFLPSFLPPFMPARLHACCDVFPVTSVTWAENFFFLFFFFLAWADEKAEDGLGMVALRYGVA